MILALKLLCGAAAAAVMAAAALLADRLVTRKREAEYRKLCDGIEEGKVYRAVPSVQAEKANPFDEQDDTDGSTFQVIEKRFADDGRMYVKYRFYFPSLDLFGSRTWVRPFDRADNWKELQCMRGSKPEVFEIHEALRDTLKKKIRKITMKAYDGAVCYGNPEEALGVFNTLCKMADDLYSFVDSSTCAKEHKLPD